MKLWHLILAGLFAVALRRVSDVFLPLAIIATIATGVALAVRVAPSLAPIRSNPRLPTAREAVSIVAGLAVAYVGFGVVDELAGVLSVSSARDLQAAPGRVNLVDDLLLPLWLLLAILPASLQFLRAGSVGQGFAGFAAAVPVGVAALLMWQSVGKPWGSYGLTDEGLAALMALIPVAGTLAAAGLPTWWRSLGSGQPTQPDLAHLLGTAMLIWLVQAAVVILGVVLAIAGVWQRPLNSGIVLGGLALVALAGVWVHTLSRLAVRERPGLPQTAIATLLLVILFGVSELPAVWIMHSGQTTIGDAGILSALLLLPIIAGVFFVCLAIVPRLLRGILGPCAAAV